MDKTTDPNAYFKGKTSSILNKLPYVTNSGGLGAILCQTDEKGSNPWPLGWLKRREIDALTNSATTAGFYNHVNNNIFIS